MGKNKVQIKNLGENYSTPELEKNLLPKKTSENIRKFYERQKLTQKKKTEFYNNHIGVHDSGVRAIYNAPELIGITNNFYSGDMEVDFYEGRVKKGSVDAIIHTQSDIYGIEFKTNDSKSNRRDAKDQLRKAQKYIKSNFGTNLTKLLYVHDNFKADILTEEGFLPFNYTPRQ